jgi:hypothetical protein
LTSAGHRLSRADAHTGNAAQLSNAGRLLRLLVQLLLDPPRLADERLDLFEQQIPPQLLRSGGQGQLAEPHQTPLGPKTRLFLWDDTGASKERANCVLGPIRHSVCCQDELRVPQHPLRGQLLRLANQAPTPAPKSPGGVPGRPP